MSRQQEKDFTNETVLSTPKPRASSTVHKQPVAKKFELSKIPLVYSPVTSKELSSSTESLGILCADDIHLASSLDAISIQNSKRQSQITNERLQHQRSLVNSILQKTTAKGLASRYLKPSETISNSVSVAASESTVSETDLLQSFNNSEGNMAFVPAEISTPRSSCASDRSINSRLSCGSNQSISPRSSLDRASSRNSMSRNIAQFSQQLRDSRFSLAELCNQFCNMNTVDPDFGQLECSKESFVPGELAGAKIAEQEQSWQREFGILGGDKARSDSIFSQMDFSNRQESISVTEFFRKKSELAELCLKDSPEKDNAPLPLIDQSVTYETLDDISFLNSKFGKSKSSRSDDESVLSITDMENQIALSDNTTRIADYIGKALTKKSAKTKGGFEQKLSSGGKPSFQNKNEFKENLEPSRNSSFKNQSAPTTPVKETTKSVLKETTFFDNVSDKSGSSMHTASSLESLPSGKLPIETNRIELTWGCVRTGKRKTQAFILRNRSHNKLRLQITSSNTNFRILSDHSESDSVSLLPIMMYPFESRAFTVMFTPTTIGAVIGKLNFSPISTELQLQQTKRQQLMLFGYGGHSKIEIENVPKDTNMKMWLSLGKLDNRLQLSRKFTICNVGSVAAFGCLNFGSKALYGYSKVSVEPTELVLQPKERTTVTVTYTPTKEDAKHLFSMTSNQIIEIGFIQIITGEEAVRGRIRRLCRKLKQESGVIGNPLIEQLSNKFPNEKMPTDLNRFTETVGSVKELMQSFDSKEISLTLEKDSERTFLGQIAGIDETSMFQSLSEGMTTVLSNKTIMESCTVEPNKLVLMPPTKTEDSILITSHSSLRLQFQTSVTPADVLQVTPCEGLLSPDETVFIKVYCNPQNLQQKQELIKVSIYVDDEVFEVDVKVIVMKCRTGK